MNGEPHLEGDPYPHEQYQVAPPPPPLEHGIMATEFPQAQLEIGARPPLDYRLVLVTGEQLADHDREVAAQIEMPALAPYFETHQVLLAETAVIRVAIARLNEQLVSKRPAHESGHGEYAAVGLYDTELQLLTESLIHKQRLLDEKEAAVLATEQTIRDYRRAKLNEYHIDQGQFERLRQ
ncbi:hypothetical protein HY523_01765 [Candidatus Berkelbacteria bacterium]|nr:hypothetical protein [Candidatus Berkelbacteria bacterium]